jgi:sugar lactone lactonase YvrE
MTGAGVYTIFSGLSMPAGVVYSNQTQMLYVAQSNKITAYDWDSMIQPLFATGSSNPAPSALIAFLPNSTTHAYRKLAVRQSYTHAPPYVI